MKLGISYIVGGDERHWRNAEKSIQSLERIQSCDWEVQVLCTDSFDIDFKTHPHRMWQMKYEACKLWHDKDVDYILYLDTDIVIVNDTIESLTEQIGDSFGVTQHFWAPTVGDLKYLNKDAINEAEFNKAMNLINIYDETEFFAGGVFLYKNNNYNRDLIDAVILGHNLVYPNDDSPPIHLVYDELILSAVLSRRQDMKVKLGGALNHCCMYGHMPLELREDGVLIGGNGFDEKLEPITAFHCDTARRDPTIGYTGLLQEKIREAFLL